ncbi:hemolysin family protein [Ensifer soli]|uniref:hemolysin family protein n=1 Tax=Ciceribacter sp. sgz301302 TaxID=3342379 RepID=UPI0035B9F713
MNEMRSQPVSADRGGSEDQPADEGGSSITAHRPETPVARNGLSFWGRAARIWRSANPATLREDLADALMTDAASNTVFSPGERTMLNNILRLRDVRVEDVMVPRADIEAVDQEISLGELMRVFEQSGRSRMPVYSDSLDDPRGMVHIRDLLSYVTKQAIGGPAGTAEIGLDLARVDLSLTVEEAGIIRQVLYVPPSMPASDLMQRMQAARIQMALVIDEYGGTDGLASLEDIVEMVVGDIEDEHDDDEVRIVRSAEDVFIADARAELEDVVAVVGPDFDVSQQIEDVDTLGGLIFATLGRIPARGEMVQAVPGFEFQVLDADTRRLKRVRIIRKRLLGRRRTSRPGADAPDVAESAVPPIADEPSQSAH